MRPLRSAFQPFLTDENAARLLRTSHTAALTLLSGYPFTAHIFQPTSLHSLRRLRDLCLLYKLRITQLAVPERLKRLNFDAAPPHLSPIPTSVPALTLGAPGKDTNRKKERRWATFSAAACDSRDRELWCLRDLFSPAQWSDGQQETGWRLTLLEPDGRLEDLLPYFSWPCGQLNAPLLPGILPHGLRSLLYSGEWQRPLQPALPPRHPALLPRRAGAEHQLQPAVDFSNRCLQPLHAGVLSSSLRWVRVWSRYRDERIKVVLPPKAQLKWYTPPAWLETNLDGESNEDYFRGHCSSEAEQLIDPSRVMESHLTPSSPHPFLHI